MSAKILDGKVVRDKIAGELKDKIAGFPVAPRLAIIYVGNNPDSAVYVNRKLALAKKIGAEAFVVDFQSPRLDLGSEERSGLGEHVSQDILIAEIKKLNADKTVHGIIIQSPLPFGLDWKAAVEMIAPEKDVDGVTSANLKLLEKNNPEGIIPATARGVLSLFKYYDIAVKGKRVVVMGRSHLVGRPIATLMANLGGLVTVCHSQTVDPDKSAREADILIVAIGQSELIGADYVKEGQVVIDVGINSVINSDGTRKIYGDVDFDSVKDIVAAISPVPGGVGPMTVVSLFQNLVSAFEKQK